MLPKISLLLTSESTRKTPQSKSCPVPLQDRHTHALPAHYTQTAHEQQINNILKRRETPAASRPIAARFQTAKENSPRRFAPGEPPGSPGATGARLVKLLLDPRASQGGSAPPRYAPPPARASDHSDYHPGSSSASTVAAPDARRSPPPIKNNQLKCYA